MQLRYKYLYLLSALEEIIQIHRVEREENRLKWHQSTFRNISSEPSLCLRIRMYS